MITTIVLLLSCILVSISLYLFYNLKNQKRDSENLSETTKNVGKAMDDFLILVNNNGKINYANESILLSLGYNQQELLNEPLHKIIHPNFRDPLNLVLANQDANNDIKCQECSLITIEGHNIPVLFNISQSPMTANGDSYYTIVGNDLTNEKETELKLASYADDLQQANRILGQYAYIAAHNFQTPLRNIAGFAQLLERDYKDTLDAKALNYIDITVKETIQLHNLINDFLEYTTLATKKLNATHTDINEVLDQVTQELDAKIKKAGVQVLYGDLPIVYVNYHLFKKLFEHIVDNAIKYRSDHNPYIMINAFQEHGNWIFAIHDNGIGIEEQYQDKVFGLFKRLHTVDKYQGTGIGLSICKRIIEIHEGKIWLESIPGSGTTCYFSIPITQYLRAVG